jgi:large subunit ribosomal protein L15
MMLIHEIRRRHPQKHEKRVGRGGKRGTYSGKGIKGQRARAGAKVKSAQRESVLRIPQRRGTGFKNRIHQFRMPPVSVDLSVIDRAFSVNAVVTPRSLVAKGIVHRSSGRIGHVKILAIGRITKPLSFVGMTASKAARERIESVGGAIR